MYGIMGGVEKTTVYLTTAQKAALARTAAAEGRSEARLIRLGIDAVTTADRAAEVRALLDATAGGREGALAAGGAATRSTGVAARPRWLARDEFVHLILRTQADPALESELRELAPGSTDEVPFR